VEGWRGGGRKGGRDCLSNYSSPPFVECLFDLVVFTNEPQRMKI